MSGSAGQTGSWSTGASQYAHGIAALALAAAATATAAILLRSLTMSTEIGPWIIFVLGMGQAVVFGLARDLSLRYRAASALALLAAFAAAFVPGVLRTTPLDPGAAVALAAVGSAPMWAVAVWCLRGCSRSSPCPRSPGSTR